jgi:hypothetical protein
MPNPQLNIGNLDFDGIKNSLKEYLSSQEIFKDYDFEGSGLTTLLDVLSYNTLYYAFYSNMIANEMFLDTAQKLSSVISLAKPLGYVVPGGRSARARIQVRAAGAGNTIPKYHLFTGNDETGRSFNFYSINEFSTGDQGVAEFDIYQGSKLFKGVELTITDNNTRGFIGRTDIDVRSLTVEVEEPGEDPVEWELSSSINENINSDSKVYFLDRTDAGFYLVFSGSLDDGINTGFGKSLPENSIVRVSYIVSGGEIGNGVSRFTSDFSQIAAGESPVIQTKEISGGGTLEPDLDAVKFFAPKTFGAQDRVVTKNDAIAVLSREFLPENVNDSNLKISVWGGEEEDPPKYGRFFFSFLSDDPNEIIPDASEVSKARQRLQQKCVVTILPEDVTPVRVEQEIKVKGKLTSALTEKSSLQLQAEIETALSNNFSRTRAFNKSVKESDILTLINGIDPAVTFDSSGMETKISSTQSGVEATVARVIKFKTPIKRNVTTFPNRSVQSTPTIGLNGLSNLQVVDKPTDFNRLTQTAPLVLITRSESGTFVQVQSESVGSVNYKTGEININPGILLNEFDISIVPEVNTYNAKQELVLVPKFIVSIEEE